MDANIVLINTTERKRLRDQYLPGIPDDVYDTLWMLEVKQEEQRTWGLAAREAISFLHALGSAEFINGKDKDAKKIRDLAAKLKKHMDENKPRYESYAMVEQE